MLTSTPKVPNDQTLQYLRDNYDYSADTGAISSKKNGKTLGCNKGRKDKMITLSVRYGRLDDGTQLVCSLYAHQVAWYLTHGVWPDKFIDHIDGNPANNRLSNLRLATSAQNSYNTRKVGKITSSKYKGVSYDKTSSNKWKASINLHGKRSTIGRYPTEEEAALAYDTRALEVFGEYSRCNFGTNSAISGQWEQLLLPWG